MIKIFTKLLVVLLLILATSITAEAQLAVGIPHTFSVTAVTPPVFPAGSVNIIPAGALADESVNLVNPGVTWNFIFAGVTYNKVVVSTNGWLALLRVTDPASIPGSVIPLPTNSLSTNPTGYPIIAPLWDDLSTSIISWVVPAASNTLWVRWSVKWDKTNATTSSLFYVKLDGNLNTTTFYYANNTTYIPTNGTASIGIAGICAGDFYSVNCTASNVANVDSVTENTNIGSPGASNFRPFNCSYTFTPYNPSDNCSGSFPAISLGTITGTCTNTLASTVNAITSGLPGNCSTSDVKDVWFSFVKPNNVTNVTVTTSSASCQSVTGTSVEVYTACGSAVAGCSTTSIANPGFGEVVLTRPCAAETLWVRVTANGDVAGKFQICAKIGGNSGATCANSTLICSVPFSRTGLTTAGFVNDYDSTSSICHTANMNGEDYVFSYTPAANQCIKISLTSTGNNPAVFIYSGCPNAGGVYCLGSTEAPTGNAVINSVSLIGGQTYYIVVDNNPVSGNTNIPFDINVTAVGTSNTYDICATASNLGTITNSTSCTPQTFSTECSTPTAVGMAGVPTCIPANNPPFFIDGVTGDVWLKFTVSFSGSLQINTYQSAINPTANAAMAIYQGASCPSSAAAPYACDYNSGPNGMPSLSIPVVNGNTYYIRVWSENPENQGNFDICFQSACSPPNDLPCASVLVPLGGTATGFNTCASSTSEPLNAAQCVAGGTINTVWYKAVVPASGSVRVRTHPLTLTDTQIQGYTFAAGCSNSATTNVSRGCNADGVPCSGGFSDFSEQLFSGMTPGDTIFVAVDGVNSLTGSFEISFIDGSTTVFPPVYQQDCAGAQVICSSSDIVVADPGFRNNGNICDLPSNFSCWGIGERNSVWYQFTADPALSGGTATVSFDILTPASVDIDFLLWDVTGNSNACTQIQSLSLPSAGCNFAAQAAATGMSPGGTGYYSPSVVFTGAPRTYLLLLNVYNLSVNAGFTLHWSTTSISSTPSNAIWSGATDNLFTTATNWGNCGTTPSCAIDATINSTSNGRQPNVTIGAAKSVRNIVINAGATLTIQAGATLNVCGNFTNFGTLVCQAGSTIQFIGGGLQTITGALTGTNSFANLVINKPSGSVQLLSNIDVAENFSTANITSIFNINGKYMKVAGDFTNFSGTTTFTGIGGSTVEFNGNANKNFTNTNGSLSLNNVRMNKTAGKLYLTGVNSKMNIDSLLTLTAGIIVTRSLASLEVNVKYYLPATIVGHNATSFIDGFLRRKISNPAGPFSPIIPASYDFPVGDSVTPGPGGYENANITFTTSTLVSDLLAIFNPWPAGAPNPGPVASECFIATYSNRPIFNHGYWTFKRSSASFGGNYNIALYNTGFTNNTGMGWTVAKTDTLPATNISLSSSWRLIGTCVTTSTAGNTQRINMNSPARDSTSFNHNYTTVQSDMPLPIELLYFTAEPKGENVVCSWETASETNNDYFEVERSSDGEKYSYIGRVNGFGNGTSTTKRQYSLIDRGLCDDLRYYRLKQVDIDGLVSYSDPVAVNCRKTSGIELYPNPANTYIVYKFYNDDNKDLQASITDITGRLIRMEIIKTQKGFNIINSGIEELSSGVYFLRISDASIGATLHQTQFFKN